MAHILLVLALQIRSPWEPEAAQRTSVECGAGRKTGFPSRGPNGLVNMGGCIQSSTSLGYTHKLKLSLCRLIAIQPVEALRHEWRISFGWSACFSQCTKDRIGFP